MDTPLYFPLPGTYGVAQLDVDATMKGLDSEAQDAARKIEPVKCLVYLYRFSRALEFPSPNRPWTRFAAYLVGPGLRAEDPENCFTADMCVPIFPNATHPHGRAPVHTTPTFPFSNCSHWAYVDVLLRVSNGDFPSAGDPDVIRLRGGQQAKLNAVLTKDPSAAVQAKRARSTAGDGVVEAGDGRDGSLLSPQDSDEEIFVWRRNVPNELVPVVTISLDLNGSLDENNLPDPTEFLRQSNALVRCVTTLVRVGIVRKSDTWKKALAEQPPSDDDEMASISRVSIVFSDETVLSDQESYVATMRTKGILRLSQVIRRILGKAESRNWEQAGSVSRQVSSQDNEVDANEPLEKQPRHEFPKRIVRG